MPVASDLREAMTKTEAVSDERLAEMLESARRLELSEWVSAWTELTAFRADRRAANSAGGVEVKALDWEEVTSPREDNEPEPTGDWEAASIVGGYYICLFEDHYEVADPDGEYIVNWLGGLDEAKAAAQADFNRRILSTIVSSPVSAEVTEEQRRMIAFDVKREIRMAFQKALADLPEIAPPEISVLLSSVHMDDAFQNEGCRLQRVHGTDAVAPRVEQECAAGAWSFMRQGILAAVSGGVTIGAGWEEHSLEEKQSVQKDAGIPHLPTDMTYEARLAVSGKGPRAYEWSDKKHRLVYDLCREIERLAALKGKE